MTTHNPYAPPVETPDLPLPGSSPSTPGLDISAQGWATVTSLSKWMRIVSTFTYIFAALIAVGSLIGLVVGGRLLSLGGSAASLGDGKLTMAALYGGIVFMLLLSVVMFFSATWIRQAAYHFYDGVLSNAESSLARGFRKFRLYLILYGIFSIIGLFSELIQLAVK